MYLAMSTKNYLSMMISLGGAEQWKALNHPRRVPE